MEGAGFWSNKAKVLFGNSCSRLFKWFNGTSNELMLHHTHTSLRGGSDDPTSRRTVSKQASTVTECNRRAWQTHDPYIPVIG